MFFPLREYFDLVERGDENNILLSYGAQTSTKQPPKWILPNICPRKGYLNLLRITLRMEPDGLAVVGLPCPSFVFINSGTHGRTADEPYGNEWRRYVAQANQRLDTIPIFSFGFVAGINRSAVFWLSIPPNEVNLIQKLKPKDHSAHYHCPDDLDMPGCLLAGGTAGVLQADSLPRAKEVRGGLEGFWHSHFLSKVVSGSEPWMKIGRNSFERFINRWSP